MKKALVLVLALLFIGSTFSQEKKRFNFDFEVQDIKQSLPDGWFRWGDYILSVDSISRSGLKSAKITSFQNGTFGCIAYRIPAKYKGKRIKLEGYMKIKEVKDGFAGLLLRIDNESNTSLAFDNMQNRNISGTKEWEKYSTELDYPDKAYVIFVGGIVTGKGEAWFDDFHLTIDGVDIHDLKEVEIPLGKIDLDREFDKGSGITFPPISSNLTEDLDLLGRVWGFLKYHHPNIAKGEYNWDYELFRVLPTFLKAPNRREREILITKWIESLGDIPIVKVPAASNENAFIKPDFRWITKDVKDKRLKEKLEYVHKNRNQAENCYIKMDPNIGNPLFTNENNYQQMPYPDAGFRLLALYRYWNIIQYFFPNKHLIGQDWNLVLKHYIPQFLNAKNELEYEIAFLKIIGDIHDTHANLWGGNNKIEEWRGGYFAPFQTKFIENKLVVTSYFNPELKEVSGPEIGDIITKIDGVDVEEIVGANLKYYPASNKAAKLRDISLNMLRSQKNEADVTYVNGGKVKSYRQKLYLRNQLNYYHLYKNNQDKCYRILENNIGYITLMNIKSEDIPVIKDIFKNAKGIIIDIRNYPSTFVPLLLGSYFLSAQTPFVKFSGGSVNNPGEFTLSKSVEIPYSKEPYKGKVIVIVNEITQSQAEYTAMALRAGMNTTIIGSTTAGADGNVSAIPLPGGMRTMISGIGVYYPDGRETQRVGIVPDIEVNPTIKGIQSGKDELLEKAIELILGK